jgi:wyosine [tRNA(Phe)-imidazoG37] synthetase (radical SAM superfamily)
MSGAVERLYRLQEFELQSARGVTSLINEMAQLRGQIPVDLLERYDRMRIHKARGVAKVVHGVCGECHLQIACGVLHSLKTEGAVLQCGNCGRYLYLAEDEPTAVPENAASVRTWRKRPHAPAVLQTGVFKNHYFSNRYVYCRLCPRLAGLSIGLNISPGRTCNFNCVYCDVDRRRPGLETDVDVGVLARELERTLPIATEGRLRNAPFFRLAPHHFLKLKGVALSGEGEPTMSPHFAGAVGVAVLARSRGRFPPYRIVILTNGSRLHVPEVEAGIRLLSSDDEVWVKLDAGTQEGMARINRTSVPIDQILANILRLGRSRPIVIQSLFCLLRGQEPSPEEILQYVHQLRSLKDQGAQIRLVQIYSAYLPPVEADCRALPGATLNRIALEVRRTAGLRTRTFSRPVTTASATPLQAPQSL